MSTVTMETLQQYLEKFGWSHYQPEEEEEEREGIIYTGWRSQFAGVFNMSIDPMVEKGCLSFRVHKVASAPRDSTPTDRLAALLMVLGWINYRTILGKFGYDVRDGEVRFSIDAPIDENDFNYAQFEHVIRIAISSAESWGPEFKALLDGEKELDELLAR